MIVLKADRCYDQSLSSDFSVDISSSDGVISSSDFLLNGFFILFTTHVKTSLIFGRVISLSSFR